MDLQEAKLLFVNEANDLLETMESCLLEVDSGDATIDEHIDLIFRAAHTIKGSAGLFGFDDIVGFTHEVESLLDLIRAGKKAFSAQICDLLLDAQRHMQQLIDDQSGQEPSADHEAGQRITLSLQQELDGAQGLDVGMASRPQPDIELARSETADRFEILIRFDPNAFRDGMDPVSQFHYVRNQMQLDLFEVAFEFPEDSFDPENCYLSCRLQVSQTELADIEDAFEFLSEDSEWSVQSLSANSQSDTVQAEQSAPALAFTSIEVVGSEPSLVSSVSSDVVVAGSSSAGDLQSDIDSTPAAPERSDPAATPECRDAQVAKEGGSLNDYRLIKVNARKLDELIGLVGELVTSTAANQVNINEVQSEKLDESFSQMADLVEQIRDRSLSLRMVQVGETFNKLKRNVRDISKELGKEIALEISGAETELDRTMVEKLSDPLLHLLRNALDHGIEPCEQRVAAGKDPKGKIQLQARHESGAVVIEIIDDGAGINSERVLQKAIEKGIVAQGSYLPQDEILQLIFEPGFSTAASVTNISGRGVGMDVVKRNIEELRGQIQIESEAGKGALFRIRLPLTLAIIDGFEVSVYDSHMVIPVNMIQECLPYDKRLESRERGYINVREEIVPLIRLSQLLRLPNNYCINTQHVVIVQYGQDKAGIVVDGLLGEIQAVIKPMNSMFQSLKFVGGSTVLGNGDVGFILDVPQIVALAIERESGRAMRVSG